MVVFLVLAGMFALVGVGMLWWRSSVGKAIAVMMATPTSKAAAAGKMPVGTLVEVIGTIRCAAPLTGEFSKKACAYYKAVVERKVQTHRMVNGKRESEEESRVDRSEEHSSPSFVEDDSGRVAISFDKAEIEAQEVVRRYEPIGFTAGSVVQGLLGAGDQTLGHTYIETMIAPDVPVFVLGTVVADMAIGASGKNPYVVSYKSKEQRNKDLHKKQMWILIAAIVVFAVALACVYGAMKATG